jgi:cbb3-type cytochrome oxidase subunit 3
MPSFHIYKVLERPLRQGGEMMSILFSLWTVFVATVFFAVVIWVLRTDKKEFNEAAQIPFQEDEEALVEEDKHG